jgi:membrane protein
MTDTSGPAGGGRIAAVQGWLRSRADTGLGRLAFGWFQRYFEASRNSGSAATIYSALSVFPTAMVAIAYFHWSGGDTNAFADRIIDHLRLDGQTADLVREMFGTAASNALAATIAAVLGFLLWGLGIGQIVQSLYARAWRIEVGSAADQWLFAVWFFVVSVALALVAVLAEQLRGAGLLVLVPVWLVGSTLFWLWTPRFLLHGRIGMRALMPGALLATGVIGGAFVTAPLWIASTLNAQGRAFGSFGIALGVLAYAFIMITMSLVCAVFSPVWAEWREAEKRRRDVGAASVTELASPLQSGGRDVVSRSE